MQARISPTAGSPVPGDECWYTVLTNSDHVTGDGTLHYQAVKGNRFKAAVNKSWAHELSGRLVSLAGDAAAIADDARNRLANVRQGYVSRGERIPSKIVLIGVACAKAVEITTAPANVPRLEIVYTPLPHDTAHSDIVTYQTATKDDLDPVRFWLMRRLHVVREPDFPTLITSCGSTVAASVQQIQSRS
jgi:hypothetical protein